MSVYPTISRAGQQFLGNQHISSMEVHDLRNEKAQCQINEIFSAGHAIRFIPDSLLEARSNGYDNCAYCIGGSMR